EHMEKYHFEEFTPFNRSYDKWSKDCLDTTPTIFNKALSAKTFTEGMSFIVEICKRIDHEPSPIKCYRILRSTCIVTGTILAITDDQNQLMQVNIAKACFDLDTKTVSTALFQYFLKMYKDQFGSDVINNLFKLFCKYVFIIRGFTSSHIGSEDEMLQNEVNMIFASPDSTLTPFEQVWNLPEPDWNAMWDDMIANVTYAGKILHSCRSCGDHDEKWCDCAKERWIESQKLEYRKLK
ncbi:MAG: hypothetical protein ACMG6E_07470, partial [Candidatus Roizmanbacteria bacterium]